MDRMCGAPLNVQSFDEWRDAKTGTRHSDLLNFLIFLVNGCRKLTSPYFVSSSKLV